MLEVNEYGLYRSGGRLVRVYLQLLPASDAGMRGSNKGYTATPIKCAIVTYCKGLNHGRGRQVRTLARKVDTLIATEHPVGGTRNNDVFRAGEEAAENAVAGEAGALMENPLHLLIKSGLNSPGLPPKSLTANEVGLLSFAHTAYAIKRLKKVKYGTHYNTTKWKTCLPCPANSSQGFRGGELGKGRISKRKNGRSGRGVVISFHILIHAGEDSQSITSLQVRVELPSHWGNSKHVRPEDTEHGGDCPEVLLVGVCQTPFALLTATQASRGQQLLTMPATDDTQTFAWLLPPRGCTNQVSRREDAQRTAVTERLACSPPTEANRVRFPDRATPVFSHVGIMPNDTAGRRVFSGISRFPRSFNLALLHTSITLIVSHDITLLVGIGTFWEFNYLYAKLHKPLYDQTLAVAPVIPHICQYGIRFLFPCKSAIDAESSIVCLTNSGPIEKVTSVYTVFAESLIGTRGRRKTALQFSDLRVEAMRELMRMARPPLALPRF
ncbi:hypothetical protein PR048_023350 [Dryococelus australis]|uniref:Uncharacterized protein n=1 Tax=Dryococelus australis TaxID=614101 RepID=A0ABQ9GTT9_9NEOP|nr:hypothetical protein PR048_023350 [Dryococelus australis]